MANNKLAIIGGSGLYDIDEFKEREFLKLESPWGKPSDEILKTKYNDKEIFFFTKTWKRSRNIPFEILILGPILTP